MDKILTLIIPTYNMEKYLDKCLTSLIIDGSEQMKMLEVLFKFCDCCKGRLLDYLSALGRCTLFIYIFHYFILWLVHIPILNSWFDANGNFVIDIFVALIPAISAITFSLLVKASFDRFPQIRHFLFYN